MAKLRNSHFAASEKAIRNIENAKDDTAPGLRNESRHMREHHDGGSNYVEPKSLGSENGLGRHVYFSLLGLRLLGFGLTANEESNSTDVDAVFAAAVDASGNDTLLDASSEEKYDVTAKTSCDSGIE